MTDRELMKQALDALEYASDQTKPENLHGCNCLICTTILALRERLAQPKRQWVEFTDEEIHDAFQNSSRRSIYRAINSKLKEKNNES